jgi:hypothetical protein
MGVLFVILFIVGLVLAVALPNVRCSRSSTKEVEEGAGAIRPPFNYDMANNESSYNLFHLFPYSM